MTQKQEILTCLESTLKVLEVALNERETAFRALLYGCGVSGLEDIDDITMYRLGADIEDQIDRLKDLIDELKYQLKFIGAFKEV